MWNLKGTHSSGELEWVCELGTGSWQKKTPSTSGEFLSQPLAEDN